jgi:competence protein ComGC
MSIHAQLSPEALARLQQQRRNSTISSLVVSILVVVLIALILGIFFLPNIVKETPVIVTYSSSVDEETKVEEKKVNTKVMRKPSSPSSSMAKVIAANTQSPTAVPVPDQLTNAPSLDFGDGDDFGAGWGDADGSGGGGGFAGIPTTMKARCSKADRMARLLAEGGTPECEDAVVKCLNWLQSTQNPDGSWTKNFPVAMTGFSLLVYLGHCETPQSPEYGETVLKAITYLIDLGMKNDGRLTNLDADAQNWVYEHGIATYALAEAYTFCSQLKIVIPSLDTVTKQAGDMIMEGQTDDGGWLYKFASGKGGDNSVGFWQIQALKACKHSGLWPKSKFAKTIGAALDWLEKVQGEDGAIGYRSSSKQSPGLTGGGVLAFQMWDKGKSGPARKGIKWISENSEFEWGQESANLYYHYYHAQAMINHGGKEWKDYNERFRDVLVKAQNPDGSWTQSGMKNGPNSIHMATCQAALMLEVYYRFLPGTGGK